MQTPQQVDQNTNRNSEIFKWILVVEAKPVSSTETFLKDRTCRFELADLGLNFDCEKSILLPSSIYFDQKPKK